MSPPLRPAASASGLTLVTKCIGSVALPKIRHLSDDANEGSALHESLAMRATHGLDASLQAWDGIAERWGLDETTASIARARLRKFTWVPPAGAMVETALALLEDGTVVRVIGGRGQYELPEGAIDVGTSDVAWSEPEPFVFDRPDDPSRPRVPDGSTLVVVDYKTGDDANVPPADRNEQLMALALLWGRWTGAERVVAGACFVRELAPFDVTSPLGTAALARIEARHRALAERAAEQRQKHARGETLDLVEGPHCTWCDSEAYCPRTTARLRALVAATEDGGEIDAPLSAEDAARAANLLPQLARLVDRMRNALKAHAKTFGPIPLREGVAWGPIIDTKDRIDGKRALPILREELGERADQVVSISKAAIDRAVADLHAEQGIQRKKGPAVARILAKLHDAGAIEAEPVETFTAHRVGTSAEIATRAPATPRVLPVAEVRL